MNAGDTTLINTYISELTENLSQLPIDIIDRIISTIRNARDTGKSVYIFGNGGSAATATHMACDLAKGSISSDRPRIKAYSLTDNTSLFSAWANDSTYDEVFAEQVENYITKGDIAIGISGSGNSGNVINGIKKAKEKGAITIGLIGYSGGKLKDFVDIPLIIDNFNIRQVEDIHLIVEHIITMCLQEGNI